MHTLKNYTIIPNELATLFSPRDIYTLAVMYLYAVDLERINKKNYYVTDITVEQIASYGNISEDYITKLFLPRLKKSNFAIIETVQVSYRKKRTTYKLPKPISNFKIIHNTILTIGLDSELKGFLIGLFTCCDYKTLHTNFDMLQICDALNISKATFYRYKKELLNIYLFDCKRATTIMSSYSRGFDIRCSWLRLNPDIDLSGDTYINPYSHVIVDFSLL